MANPKLIEAKTNKPMYALEAEAFAAAVAGGEPWITREDTLGNMKVLDQLRAFLACRCRPDNVRTGNRMFFGFVRINSATIRSEH